jgi:glycosyltransferase involved in cell wall biosynthesis
MNISFIIPTIGRDSLERTVDSIKPHIGDQVLVMKDIPPTGMWGNNRRNEGMKLATCEYLAFIDDDDWYVDGAREIMEKAIRENPGKPLLFRIRYPSGEVIWKDKLVLPGNVSTQMIVVPNNREMLHHWEGKRNMADYIFIDKWKWLKEDIIWRDEILVNMGHD